MENLNGKKIAILATDGFEESELVQPMSALIDAGAKVDVISLKDGEIKSWRDDNWGDTIKVDLTVANANPENNNGLLLPGGVMNPDRLRKNKAAVEFVKGFFMDKKQKPVAAICHGPWMLAEAGVIKGRKLTSYGSIKTDLVNAGAKWVDEEVVVDQGLVTSRSPKDLSAFCKKMVEEYSEGKHQKVG